MVVGGGEPSYILNEGFEGTGTPSGWGSATNITFDYTWNGGQAMRINDAAAGRSASTPTALGGSTAGGVYIITFEYFKESVANASTGWISANSTVGGIFTTSVNSSSELSITSYHNGTTSANFTFANDTQ